MIFCSLLFLGLLLFCPEAAIQGSKYGSALWLNELIPTLLPFFIGLHLFQLCLPKAASHKAFLLLGLLCGYPSGASLVADQYNQGLLTTTQAYFYLGFVNNPSPMFILSFCCFTLLHMTLPAALFFFCLVIFSGFTGSFLFYVFLKMKTGRNRSPEENILSYSCPTFSENTGKQKLSLARQLDNIILESFILIAKIGGYVILFSILGQFIRIFLSPSSISGILCLGSIEITSGISYLQISALPLATKEVLTASLLAFGGLSAAAQTSSVLSQSGLSVFPYIINKLINAGIAGLLCYLLFNTF